MKTIANENEHQDHLQLKQLLEEAKPLMLRCFLTSKRFGSRRVRSLRRLSRFLRSTLSITPKSALSSAQCSLTKWVKLPRI